MPQFKIFNFILFFIIILVEPKVFSSTFLPHTKNIFPITRTDFPPDIDAFKRAMIENNFDSIKTKDKIEGLITRFPVNGKPISEKTIVFLSYDLNNIYSVFVCYDKEPEKIISTLAMRDDMANNEDAVALQLITMPKSQQMYGFQSNALGSKLDGVYSEGIGWDSSYDPVWYTETKKTNTGYIVKLTIPLSSLRFPPKDIQNWRFFVFRGIPRKNEKAYFPIYSSDIQKRIPQSGALGPINIDSRKLKTSYVPFITSQLKKTKNKTIHNIENNASNLNAGLDAKIVWNEHLVFDIALNPDFSQVESDEPQVLANQRFRAFFPEKRPFFVENSNFFQNPLALFFSRNIIDPSTGIKLTGQIQDYSIATIAVDDTDNTTILATNIRKTLNQNSFLGFFASRYTNDIRSTNNLSIRTQLQASNNWLFDSQIAISNNKNKTTIHSDYDRAAFFSLSKSTAAWNYSFSSQYISKGFSAPVGFIKRKGITDLRQNYSYRVPINRTAIIAYELSLNSKYVWNTHGLLLDNNNQIKFEVELPKQSFFSLQLNKKNEVLTISDYPILINPLTFKQGYYNLNVRSSFFHNTELSFSYLKGDAVNYKPVASLPPSLSSLEQTSIYLDHQITPRLKFGNRYIYSKLNNQLKQHIFTSRLMRVKTTYQFNRELSLRLILDYNKLEPNGNFSSIINKNILVKDLLFAWEPSSGKALYFGIGDSKNKEVLSSSGIVSKNEKEQIVFLKFSYLFKS